MSNKPPKKKKVLIAFGTRPEALKFVPLIKALQEADDLSPFICLTGQHREMLDQVIQFFRIPIHADLRLMRQNQTLEYVSGRVISRFGKIINRAAPDIVFVQGDTATALMVGISSFYARKPIAHLEAGLRTYHKFQPFPEEMNRTLLSHLADMHFTPTGSATRNLLNEGIPREDIYQIGNTIVDTVQLAATGIKSTYPVFRKINVSRRLLFVTAHRRESFGQGLESICSALKRIVERFPDVEIVYPVHLNPNVRTTVHRLLDKTPRIHLLRPFTYEETLWILAKCHAVLTDSGGIQEEAPSFKKPVLVLRNVTERAEGLRAGAARLVGTEEKRIFDAASALLKSNALYKKMQPGRNPYGDGKASGRIVKILRRELARDPFRTIKIPPLMCAGTRLRTRK